MLSLLCNILSVVQHLNITKVIRYIQTFLYDVLINLKDIRINAFRLIKMCQITNTSSKKEDMILLIIHSYIVDLLYISYISSHLCGDGIFALGDRSRIPMCIRFGSFIVLFIIYN